MFQKFEFMNQENTYGYKIKYNEKYLKNKTSPTKFVILIKCLGFQILNFKMYHRWVDVVLPNYCMR